MSKKGEFLMDVNYHILKNTIVINYLGKTIKVDRKTKLGEKVISLIKNDQLIEIPSLIDYPSKIKKESNNLFDVKDGILYSENEKVPSYISKRVFEFMENDLPFEYLIKFWNNLKLNPSRNSKTQLFKFLEENHFPITSDGYFIAYKKVQEDYLDDYTKKIDNTPGKVVEMLRNDVVDDPTIACASGLHIAPFNYAKQYKGNRGKLIELKINPKDVVSVPNDYSHQKARVCKYTVLRDAYEEELKPTIDVSEIKKPKKKSLKIKDINIIKVIKIGSMVYNVRNITDYLNLINIETFKHKKKSTWPKSIQFEFIDLKQVKSKKVGKTFQYVGITKSDEIYFISKK